MPPSLVDAARIEAREEGVGASPRSAYRLYFCGQNVVLREALRLGP